jgi:hypothetical protein
MRIRVWLAGGLLCATVAALFLGCAHRPTRTCQPVPFDVRVSVSDSLAGPSGKIPSIEVHLLALKPSDAMYLQDVSMSQYWDPNRSLGYVTYKMYFADDKRHQTLDRSDSIWRRWLAGGAEHLFIMADLPGSFEDKQNVEDPRRAILPLDSCRWTERDIQVIISESGIHVVTPFLPPYDEKK